MRLRVLKAVFSWLAALLILRVLAAIIANYPDYFPPNFDSLFLQGREATFHGIYRIAFYIHIFSSPIVLFVGLILLSDTVRRHRRDLHRVLGYVQVSVLLLFVLPSSLIMSWHAFGGWPAGLSFALLSIATGFSAVAGVMYARRRRYDGHRRWMNRTYLLICSAVFLRLISGTANLAHVPNAEGAYIVAAWSSWLVPLGIFEIMNRWRTHRLMMGRSDLTMTPT